MANRIIPTEELIKALLDTDTPLAARYLYRFSDISDSDFKQIQLIWDTIPSWRRLALLQDAQNLGDKDLVLSFESLARIALQDNDPNVRILSLQILENYETTDLISVFINLMHNDPDVPVRATAASVLGRFVYLGEIEEIPEKVLHKIEDQLLSILQGNEDKSVRQNALEAIGYSGRKEVAPLIENAFNSGDLGWIASSLTAMGNSADNRWKQKIIKMLGNIHPGIRNKAAWAAGELELQEAVPQLMELTDDPDDDTRQASIWSLSLIGGEGVRSTLENLLGSTQNDEDEAVLNDALEQLSLTEEFSSIPLLELDDEDLIDDDLELDEDLDE